MTKALMLAAAAACLLAAAPAAAQDGDDWSFTLKNRSPVAVTQFNTFRNGRWSSNWLKSAIPPAGSRALHFNGGDQCEERTRVTFRDGSYFDGVVDYCDTDNVVVSDEEFWAE